MFAVRRHDAILKDITARTGTALVVTAPCICNGRVHQTHLLRRSYRQDGAVRNETLGNLPHLPEPLIEIIRRAPRGETFVPAGDAFEVPGSRAHGHVQAVHGKVCAHSG